MSSTSQPKRVLLLGATGSIGRQTLDVLDRFRDDFRLVGASAHSNAMLLTEIVEKWRPEAVALTSPLTTLNDDLDTAVRVANAELYIGEQALAHMVATVEADIVVLATVGIAGLVPALMALDRGIDIALANKEVLVCGGELVTSRARAAGARLLPVDSEHNAVMQCIEAADARHIRRIVLTASGGPFREWPAERIAAATRDEALAHPTWSMGEKISIDSATMMNKGLEVIEAHWLFGLPADQIEVVIHPQSTIHSMAEFTDGSVLAQLGPTDMRLPIQHCLTHPDRRESCVEPLDFTRLGRLEFEAADPERFPCLGLAYGALRRGGLAPVVLNAANEIAVADFLAGRISFGAIAETVERALREVLAADDATAPAHRGAPPATNGAANGAANGATNGASADRAAMNPGAQTARISPATKAGTPQTIPNTPHPTLDDILAADARTRAFCRQLCTQP